MSGKPTVRGGLIECDLDYGPCRRAALGQQPISKGRDGSFLTAGLRLRGAVAGATGTGVLTLLPRDARGKARRSCFIEMPARPEFLRRLSRTLDGIADRIERGR
jgi:hypothetical protein